MRFATVAARILALAAYLSTATADTNNYEQDPDLNPARCPDFCAGTNSTGDKNVYVCGDSRLGPTRLPTTLPLAAIVGDDSSYHRFGGACPGEFLAQWTSSSTGQFQYPPFQGYLLEDSGSAAIFNTTLPVGTVLDRFGSEYGAYLSAAGTPYAQRSLPPTNLVAAPNASYPYNYHIYIVSQTLGVQGGPIAGWFGQQGLGLQFLAPMSVLKLIEQGYLVRYNLTNNTA